MSLSIISVDNLLNAGDEYTINSVNLTSPVMYSSNIRGVMIGRLLRSNLGIDSNDTFPESMKICSSSKTSRIIKMLAVSVNKIYESTAW